MSLIDDQEFEPVVRDAMIARSQPGSISNLAYRAMELARAQTLALARAQIEFVARMRRRGRWVSIFASLLIVAVVFLGIKQLTNAGLIGGTSTTAVTSSNTDSSSTTSSISTLGVELTAEFLVVAMILLSAGIASSRPDYVDTAFFWIG